MNFQTEPSGSIFICRLKVGKCYYPLVRLSDADLEEVREQK